MRLLLLDIDGTLVRVHGAGTAAIETAVAAATGRPASTDGVSFSGRTDPNILRDVIRANDLVPEPDLVEEVTARYTEAAQEAILEENVERLPGTARFLSLLAERDDVYLALVTGNVEPVAYQKLRAAGFDQHFSVGAFGSDHATRSKLPRLAMRRATEHTGYAFSMEDTIVIGDTGRDVECAREAGALAAAVATGHPSSSDLAAFNPDLLLDSFEPPELTIQRILGIFAE
jgi:phosphoglycolate phosphatase-like HAD superfamily hydrolase